MPLLFLKPPGHTSLSPLRTHLPSDLLYLAPFPQKVFGIHLSGFMVVGALPMSRLGSRDSINPRKDKNTRVFISIPNKCV